MKELADPHFSDILKREPEVLKPAGRSRAREREPCHQRTPLRRLDPEAVERTLAKNCHRPAWLIIQGYKADL